MILARLSRAIREQNWFAVTIEFLIVILGVVIGFQITAWNADRERRALEAATLCNLLADFNRIETDMAEHVSDAEVTSREAQRIAEAAQRGAAWEELGRFSELALQLRYPPAGSATYDQLVSSGDLDLIRSQALRTALTNFGTQLARHQESGNSHSLMMAELSGPVFRVIRLSPEDVETMPDPLRAELERFVTSAEFMLAATALLALADANVGWKRVNLERASAVMAALAPQTGHCAAS